MTICPLPLHPGEVMKLAATYTEGNAGIWSVTCADCPIAHHAAALGQKTPECLSGIATNMQGPMVLNKCAHTSPDCLANDGDSLALECRYGQ